MASETGETSAAAAEAEAWAAEVVAGEGERKITLVSREGQEYVVSEAAARVSPNLMGMLGDDDRIQFENIPGPALATVVKYCNEHAAANASAAATASSSSSVNPAAAVVVVDDEDRELVGGLGTDDLYDVLIAAHYLGLEGLVDAACERVANMIKEKTPRQIRATFNITDDLTAAEKAQIRRQYAWAFYDGDM